MMPHICEVIRKTWQPDESDRHSFSVTHGWGSVSCQITAEEEENEKTKVKKRRCDLWDQTDSCVSFHLPRYHMTLQWILTRKTQSVQVGVKQGSGDEHHQVFPGVQHQNLGLSHSCRVMWHTVYIIRYNQCQNANTEWLTKCGTIQGVLS